MSRKTFIFKEVYSEGRHNYKAQQIYIIYWVFNLISFFFFFWFAIGVENLISKMKIFLCFWQRKEAKINTHDSHLQAQLKDIA